MDWSVINSIVESAHQWLSRSRLDPSGWERLHRLADDDKTWWLPGVPTYLTNPLLGPRNPTGSPMRLKNGVTVRLIANILSSLGLGCHFRRDDRDTPVDEVVAITVHAISDGEERSFDLVLEPKWKNPWRTK